MSDYGPVVDYGSGNLHGVFRGIEFAGEIPVLATNTDDISRAERLLLPGVGAFEEGIKGIRERELIEPLQLYVKTGASPFLEFA